MKRGEPAAKKCKRELASFLFLSFLLLQDVQLLPGKSNGKCLWASERLMGNGTASFPYTIARAGYFIYV